MRRLLFTIASLGATFLMLLPLSVTAQQKVGTDNPLSKKFSMTTRLFLNELKDGGFDPKKQEARRNARRAALGPDAMSFREPRHRSKNDGRFYAAPDTINGRAYVSAFITLDDNNDVSALESLGVQVQCKFNDGIITSEIPLDKLEDVAAMSNVKRISVSEVLKPCTNLARQLTNVDDVLTLSASAHRKGIDKKYNGKGVLLGVIDIGIDFDHIAFKDKDGNSRIVGGFICVPQQGKVLPYQQFENHTDDETNDHGTHTASTAGGSSVIIDGSEIRVTDEHGNATYGGMAPESSLYLIGLGDLKLKDIATCMKVICDYADSHSMPVVISLSIGSQYGPHNGTGEYASICKQLFGNNNKDHICLFSSGNEAGNSKDNEGGGLHVYGIGSESHPVSTIIRESSYSDYDAGCMYSGQILYACPRYSCTPLSCNIYVLDSKSGEVLTTVPVSKSGIVTGLENYYDGDLHADFDNGVYLYTTSEGSLITKDADAVSSSNGDYYVSKYTLAVDIYPTTGSTAIDIWGDDSYFTSHLKSQGHSWTAGSDDMSVSNYATSPDVISVGAYVSRVSGKDYKGTPHLIRDYNAGDIALFSGYGTKDQSPTGEFYPWITAPGTCVIAGVNHYHTNGFYLGTEDHNEYYRVNNNTMNPYGTMSGTSMSCPVAAGIVALWLQAAKEKGLELTTSDVKEIMAKTAIRDDYVTNGWNASHFGNGKINALAGLKMILDKAPNDDKPVDNLAVTNLAFENASIEEHTIVGTTLKGTMTITNQDSHPYAGSVFVGLWNGSRQRLNTYHIDLAGGASQDVDFEFKNLSVGDTYKLRALVGDRDWEMPTFETHGFATDEEVYLYNVGAHQFFTQGNANATQASIGDEGRMMKFTKTDNGDYTLSCYCWRGAEDDGGTLAAAWRNVYFDSETAMFVDGASQANTFFCVTDNGNGTFRLSASENNPDFSNYQGTRFVGLENGTTVTTLRPFLLPNEGQVDWAVVTKADYEALMKAPETSNVKFFESAYLDCVAGEEVIPDDDDDPANYNLTRLEYWFDNDISSRRAFNLSGTATTVDDVIPTKNLSDGLHILNLRVRQASDLYSYSPVSSVFFMKHGSQAELGKNLEYWYEEDFGNRKEVPIPTEVDDEGHTALMLDLTDFPTGYHQLSYRVSGSSHSSVGKVGVLKVPTNGYSQLEYWLDNDIANRQRVTGVNSQDGALFSTSIDLSYGPVGLHRLNYRTVNSLGIPSSAVYTSFIYKHNNDYLLEYWFDDSKDRKRLGGVPRDGGMEYFHNLDFNNVSPGVHRLYYRTVNTSGEPGSAVSMTPVMLHSRFNPERATMESYVLMVDNDSIASTGPMSATNEAELDYTLSARHLAEGSHTLKYTFWNSFGRAVTDESSFWVSWLAVLPGDVNLDGQVGIGDIVAVTNYMAGNGGIVTKERADVNGDGEVGIGDIVAITNIMAGSAAARQQ